MRPTIRVVSGRSAFLIDLIGDQRKLIVHSNFSATVALGQIRDNLALSGVVSGSPPKQKPPIKTGQIAPNCLERSRKKRLLTGGLLVRVQPEEPIVSMT